jgi:hypothetical protein
MIGNKPRDIKVQIYREHDYLLIRYQYERNKKMIFKGTFVLLNMPLLQISEDILLPQSRNLYIKMMGIIFILIILKMGDVTCVCGCSIKQSYFKKHLLPMKHLTLLNSFETKIITITDDPNLIYESDLANFKKIDIIHSIERFLAKQNIRITNLYVGKIDGLIEVINKYKIPLEDISKDKKEQTKPNIIYNVGDIHVETNYNNTPYQVVYVS